MCRIFKIVSFAIIFFFTYGGLYAFFSARAQYFKVHENASYDLEIDIYVNGIEENVFKIKDVMKQKRII
jgi:hypothetical protein